MWAFSTACFASKKIDQLNKQKGNCGATQSLARGQVLAAGGSAHLLALSDFPWKDAAQMGEFRVVIDTPRENRVRICYLTHSE